jgi:hypothetical protein
MRTRTIRALTIVLLAFMLVVCIAPEIWTPVPTVVPEGKYSALSERYYQEIDARRDDIELRLELPKTQYAPSEDVEFRIILTNASRGDVVVRKPDGLWAWTGVHIGSVRADTPLADHDVVLLVTTEDSTISLYFPEVFPIADRFGMVGDQEDFVLLRPDQHYMASISMPRVELLEGRYLAQVIYRNHWFGTTILGDPENVFLDYHAWMGEIASNTVRFEVVGPVQSW